MKDLTIDTHLKTLLPSPLQEHKGGGGSFAETLSQAVAEVNDSQLRADQAAVDLQTGKADNLHDVMLAMEEADVSMRLLVQFRNKVTEAYKEIMNMQV
ncbi:MAG: flagellar hook-basal body complex protein FliE [Desulfuromonadaceae bacterium]|nr:flagellar hook-basal body complex protein FliE [Desulfuromonadaceae bacterium]